MTKNYKQVFAIQAENEKRIKKLCPDITDSSGIYIFTRMDENGIKYAYIGQAKNSLQRAAAHLSGHQWIDLSIKKHGLFNLDNEFGWHLRFRPCSIDRLDTEEQIYIKIYAELGYQLRNATTGGQGEGKKSIVDYGRGGYLKGKNEGRQKAYAEIGTMIDKYTIGLTSKGGKVADRKTAELNEILRGEKQC